MSKKVLSIILLSTVSISNSHAMDNVNNENGQLTTKTLQPIPIPRKHKKETYYSPQSFDLGSSVDFSNSIDEYTKNIKKQKEDKIKQKESETPKKSCNIL